MALVHPQSITLPRDDSATYSLPAGFPSAISSDLVWTGTDLADETKYIYHLTAADLAEIDAALHIFKTHELDGDLADRTTFPLPRLQHTLDRLCRDVHDGKGLFLIRGLTPDLYTVEDSMVIFMGLQVYIGEQKARQDSRGNMIVHIISDAAVTSAQRAQHARHSRQSIAFHTEATGDLLAWQTRSTAASGGKCIISSAYTVYNILAATCPAIIRTLAAPDWPFAFPTPHRRPILYHHASRLIINYSPTSLLGSAAHPRPSSLPTLTTAQHTALAALETVARATQLEIATQPGDLHFINNMAILHRRNAFVDHDDDGAGEAAKRHLVRMRLRSATRGWEVPRELRKGWEEAFGEGAERQWHLFPMPEGFFPLRKFPE